MKTAFLRILSACCIAIAIATAAGCASGPPKPAPGADSSTASDEQQIRAVLERLRDDIDHRRLPRVLAAVSDKYKDDAGRDYEAVRALLSGYFSDYRDINITRTPPQLTISRDEARSIETLGIAGEPRGGKVPPLTFQGRVSVNLRRVEDTWQVIKVQLLQ